MFGNVLTVCRVNSLNEIILKLLLQPPMRGFYVSRGTGRGAKPTRRPVRVTVRPGRGRGGKTTSRGRGITIDSSAT